jgi:excisionase family DNA binding protein
VIAVAIGELKREPLVGTNGGRSGRYSALRFAADAGDDTIAGVLLLDADLDDNHHSLEICVKNLIIAPSHDQKRAVERLAYSPDEVAELLGISRELAHDLLRTGQLGSVKAGRHRLISKRHLEAFLAREE